MTTSKDLFCFFAIAASLCSQLLFAVPYEVRPAIITPGERAVVKFRLKASLFPEDSDELPIINDKWLAESKAFKVLDQRLEKEEDDWVWRYEITAYQMGSFTVPPIEVKIAGETYSAEATTVTVDSTRAPNDLEIRPNEGPMKKSTNWGHVGKITSGLVLLIVLASGGLYLKTHWKLWMRRWRGRPAPPPIPLVPQEDPRDWLRRQLALLKAETLASRASEPLDALTGLLREFYMRKHFVPAKAFTSTEITYRIKEDPTVQKIKDVFSKCDVFRFAATHQIELTETQLALQSIQNSELILLC